MWIDEYLFREKESVTNFAKALGISRGHLTQVIAGTRRASPNLAEKIEKLTKNKVTRMEVLYRKTPVKKE